MKSRHALITSIILIPVTALLRILQYIFIIDKNGYFSLTTLTDTIISYSLYGVYILAAVISVILYISGTKSDSGYHRSVNSPAYRVICFMTAAVILFDSGIRIGRMLEPLANYTDWVAVLGVPTAIFFITQLFKVKSGVISAITGFFPSVYICSRGIEEFFESFEKSHISESTLELLTICAVALFALSICVMHAGSKMTEKRLAASALLVCAVTPATSLSRIAGIVTSKYPVTDLTTDILWIAIQTMFIAFAVLVLIRLTFVKTPDPEPEPESADTSDTEQDPLDLYITDIPEESQDNEN